MDLDKLSNLKKGQDCYILACGSSLNKYDNEETRKLLKTKLVFSVKQAYDRFKEETDFHFWNCSNIPIDYMNIPYRYVDHRPEVVVASSNYPRGRRWNIDQEYDVFFRIPLIEEMGGREETLAYKRNFNDFLIETSGEKRQTGPGIMLETVFYTAIHTGVKSITTIGWDLNDYNNHFYEGQLEVDNEACEIPWDMKLNAKAVPSIKKWIESKGIEIKVLK